MFLHKFPPSPVAVIGPLILHPSVEGGVGRRLMHAALTHARKQNHDQIRLVQSPSHIRSFVLHTKSGFTLREPLFLMQGQPLKGGNNTSGLKSSFFTSTPLTGIISSCGSLATSQKRRAPT